MEKITFFKNILFRLNYILNRKQKMESILVFFSVVLGSALELLSISIIYPFLQVIMNSNMSEGKWYTNLFHTVFPGMSKTEEILIVAIGIIIIYIGKNTLLIAVAYLQSAFSAKIYQELSTRMLRSYLRRPYSFFINTNSSIMLRGISIDINGVYNIISNLYTLFSEILTVLVIAVYLLLIDWTMLLGAMGLAIICMVIIVLGFKEKMKRAGGEIRQSAAEKNQYAYQAFNGIKEIIVLERTEQFVNKYQKAAYLEQRAVLKSSFFSACPDRILEGICISGFIGIICVRIALGVDLVSFMPIIGTFAMATFRIMPSISKISVRINNLFFYEQHLNDTYKNIKDVNEYEKGQRTDKSKEQKIYSDSLKKGLELEGIVFRYDNSNHKIFDNISLYIKKGESVGIIGASGAGKTTLVEILLGLLVPEQGSVRIDGQDISHIQRGRSKIIGYVPQTVFLIDDTIRNNIAFGLDTRDISDEKVWEALKQAQLDEFINKLPNGLDTLVGERGIKFSGGQRQRIAIARALYENPDILVLDEATSALDYETENAVMESIETLHGSKTLIIVAHRLETIQKCDRIFEIRNGFLFNKDIDSCNILE